MKRLMMIAGPNGAGKTTTANAFLSQQKDLYDDFLNADHIAQGLSPLHPESVNRQAGELMIKRFHDHLKLNVSFAFETTASGISYANHLKKAKENGYEINLMFLWLSSPDQAVKRVAQRVRQGGHNIPEDDIRRRYHRGLKNLLNLYLPLASTALILDNSSAESGTRKIIARKDLGFQLQVEDEEIWEKIQRSANVKI
jgi:predicted ABC-type ATPase